MTTLLIPATLARAAAKRPHSNVAALPTSSQPFDEQSELTRGELDALAVVAKDQSEPATLEPQGTPDENVVELRVSFENVDSERNNDGSGFIVDDETQGATSSSTIVGGSRP